MTRAQDVEARIGIEPLFGAFFSENQLSPEQISRVKDAIAATAIAIRTIGNDAAARREKGDAVSRSEIRSLIAEKGRLEAQELASILGEQGYAKFKDYAKTAPLREITNQMASRLYHTSEPLDAKTAKSVIDALSSNLSGTPVADPRQIDWASAETKLSEFLTPNQLTQILEIRDSYNVKELIDEARRISQP